MKNFVNKNKEATSQVIHRNNNRNSPDVINREPEHTRLNIKPQPWESPSLPKNASHVWNPEEAAHSDRSQHSIQIEEHDFEAGHEQGAEDPLDFICDSMQNTYFVLYNNQIIAMGFFEEIQEQVSALVFGVHPLCDGEPVPADRLSVIKKVEVRVGVFLEG